MEIIDSLRLASENLELPDNYYHGLCLPEKFALPDSILMFFSRWGVSDEQSHGRYQLVIPFSPVIYCVENFRYELRPGLGLLLSPWQKHNHLAGSEKVLCERLLITFELPSPQSYLPDSQLVEVPETAMHHAAKMLVFYRNRQLPETAWTLIKLLKELSGKPASVSEQRLSELTVKSLSFISKNINTALDIQFIADSLQISASHLRMIFRTDIGISIGKYIAEQRMLLACVQLQNDLIPIQMVAENCGFASTCAFSHFFKNKSGISPRQFRLAALHRG